MIQNISALKTMKFKLYSVDNDFEPFKNIVALYSCMNESPYFYVLLFVGFVV